jgi:hypothetical protein
MGQYGARRARDDKGHMRIAYLTTKATDTHSYVILVSNSYCFCRQRQIKERASMLRYTHITCLLVLTKFQLVAILLHLEVYRHTSGS